MPSKSEKSSSRICSRQAFALLASWVLASLAPVAARANVSVTPLDGGSNSGTNFYYAVAGTPGAVADPDPTFPFRLIDVSKTQGGLNPDVPGRPNLLVFNVVTDKQFTPVQQPQQLVLQVTVNGAGSAGAKPVPIEQVNGIDCGSVGSPCQAQGNVTNGTPAQLPDADFNSHFFAAQFTAGNPIQIGLYPRDICVDYYKQAGAGNAASGCDVNTQQVVAGSGATGAPAVMTLNFNFLVAPDSAQAPTGTVQDSISIAVTFEADAPTLNCPDLSNVYFPGDGQILLDTSNFGINTLPGRAPATTLIVAGADGGAVDTSASFQAKNSFVTRVPYGGQQPIGGFTNTTNGGDHKYNIAFMMRDAAGLVAFPPSSCQIPNVQTATIQGFLAKSNCFIATAAFRDIDAAPVVMLRAFRDQVLLHSAPGKAFVHWYYAWSPGAAEWLMLHPEFRFPVLLALIPVQTLAWLALHPALLAALALAGLAVLAGAIPRRSA